MSEEEIIKQIKNDLYVGEFYGITEDAVKGLLDLYNKQKEELEDLKDVQQQICNEELLTQEYVQNNFISKDKIRNKIKNLEKSKEFNEVITIKFRQHGFENGVNIKFLIDIMIDILKSLL